MTRIRWLAVPLAAALAQGCASPEPSAGKTVLMQSPSELIVVLPLNLTAVMPLRLEATSPRIWAELEVYLEAHGARLKTLAFPTARKWWLDSIREARAGAQGSRAGFEDAARIFVTKVAPHADFGSVVVPSLFVQGAKVSERTASWDGALRELAIDEGNWAGQLGEDTPFAGAVPAASLHAVVLDAQGEVVQEGQSGLALLVSIRVGGRPGLGPPTFELEDLAQPFADREAILEGIARALSPFLSPLAPSLVLERSSGAER